MIPINRKDEMVDGKYYLCYEVFNSYPDEVGDKSVVIGKYDRPQHHLIGTLYECYGGGDAEWLIYRDFKDDGAGRKQVQWVFELTEDEILRHIVAEEI